MTHGTKQSGEASLLSDQLTLPQRLKSDWLLILIGAIWSFELASVLMTGWPNGLVPYIRFPYLFKADGIAVQWEIQRLIEGWIFENSRSGFPFGSNFLDYPGSDAGSYLIIKILGTLSRSNAATFNLYFLFSFPASFTAAFVVLRSFGVRRSFSFMSAVLFTFAPFHFSRLFYGHEYYNWYFTIPIFFYYGKNLFFHRKPQEFFKSWRGVVGLVFAVAALSSFGVYYAFFGVIVLVLCGVASAFRSVSVKPLRNTALFCIAITLGIVINLFPNITYRMSHGVNSEVAARSAAETEVYGLKIMHLILPQPDHRIKALRDYTKTYNATFPLSNTTSALGIVGTIGFLSILLAAGAALTGRRVDPRLGLTATVVIALLLISTVGGFNVVFATLVTPLIRGWDRINIFLNFGSFLAFTLIVDSAFRSKNRDKTQFGVVAVASAITIVGLWDQMPASYLDRNQKNFDLANTEEGFIHQIEAVVPPHSAIYELPYERFPEAGPIAHMSDYQLASGFLYSKTLRWSYGGMRGCAGDLFYRGLTQESAAVQISAIEKLGFSGVYINRLGYDDHGADVITEFTKALGTGPLLYRSDTDAVFFKLPSHAAIPPDGLTAKQLMERAGYYADEYGPRSDASMSDGINFSSVRLPNFVSGLKGLSSIELFGRWSDARLSRDVEIDLNKPLPDRFTLEIVAVPYGPNAGKQLALEFGSVRKEIPMPDGEFDIRVPIDMNGVQATTIKLIPPFPTSPNDLGSSGDPRKIGIGLKTLKIQ
jgi:phosphoglycerol transferase